MLARKGAGREAKLSYAGHVLLDNRHGLVANVCVTPATGTAERDAAHLLLEASAPARSTVGGDKNFDVAAFVAAARALAFGRVKVCGLTDPDDVELAASCGAAFAGLILVPGTPRGLEPAQARPLALVAAANGMKVVAVFRDAALERVAENAAILGAHAVQLHGSEDSNYIAGLRELLPPHCEIWTAAGVGEEIQEARPGSDRTLFDTMVNGRSGGTGKMFDWSRLAGREDAASGLLAGGLDPANARAASRVGAFALDVGSGVEAAPGRKDAAKLRAFFQALRAPARGDAAC